MEFLKQFFLNSFDPTPARSFNYLLLLEIISAVFILGSVVLRIYIKRNKENKAFKRTFRSYPGKMMTVGLILACYLFFRVNVVAFFSMRILLYIILATMAWLTYKFITDYFQKYPIEKKRRDEQMSKNELIKKYRKSR